MDSDSSGALSQTPPRSARAALAGLCGIWCAALVSLLWVCFLRPPPRSLEATLLWYREQPVMLLAGALLMVSLSVLAWRASPWLCALSAGSAGLVLAFAVQPSIQTL